MKIIFTDYSTVEFISENSKDDAILKYLQTAMVYTRSYKENEFNETLLGRDKRKTLTFSKY